MFGSEQAPLGARQWPITRWRLAEKFGWPLHVIDDLPYEDLLFWFGMQDADQRYAEQQAQKARKRKRR